MIKAACEFGAKAIYVEKPFARSLKECDLISEACKRSGTLLAVAHRNRYHPALAVAKKLIKDGLLGQVLPCEAEASKIIGVTVRIFRSWAHMSLTYFMPLRANLSHIDDQD